MTVYEYEIKERKDLARQAAHRKGTRGGKSCKLSTDGMSRAEIEKKHGQIEKVNLDRKITYADFRKLSKSLQTLYLEHLRDKYGARRIDIAEMMGCSEGALRMYCKSAGVNVRFGRGRMLSREWLEFTGQIEPKAPETPTEKTPEHIPEAPTDRMTMAECAMVFTGEINIINVVNAMARMIGDRKVDRIEIKAKMGE